MRVLLIGQAVERARLRAELDRAAVEVVGEFASVNAARAAGLDADAIVMATDQSRSSLDVHGAGDDEDYAEPLTPREIQVLELLAEGLPNKAIAERLTISDQTVKFHIASISGKLGAANRTDIVRRAVRRGLITL